MGKRKIAVLMALPAIALVVGLGIYLLFPSDEDIIRENLERLRKVMSKKPDDSIMSLAGRTGTLNELFIVDCSIIAGPPVPRMNGRQDLVSIFALYWQRVSQFSVKFTDVAVTVDSDAATAHFTAYTDAISQEGNVQAREIRMDWVRTEEGWKISKVEKVETLR